MTTDKVKAYDAVNLKNDIQDRLRAERATVGEAEADRRQREWRQTSDDPLAKLWRTLQKATK